MPLDVRTSTGGYATDVRQIVGGGTGWACALLASGSVACWGQNGGIFADGTGAMRDAVPATMFVPGVP